MNTYFIEYKMHRTGKINGVDVLAKNKADVYEKAVYETIPTIEGEHPYSVWVVSVTYQNGNYHHFNTFEGNPY